MLKKIYTQNAPEAIGPYAVLRNRSCPCDSSASKRTVRLLGIQPDPAGSEDPEHRKKDSKGEQP